MDLLGRWRVMTPSHQPPYRAMHRVDLRDSRAQRVLHCDALRYRQQRMELSDHEVIRGSAGICVAGTRKTARERQWSS